MRLVLCDGRRDIEVFTLTTTQSSSQSHDKWLASLFSSGLPSPELPVNFPLAIRQVLMSPYPTLSSSMLDLSAWSIDLGQASLELMLSRSKTWQNKIYQICQEIHDTKHQAKSKEKHILNIGTPKIYYRGKTVSLDTHGESATDDAYSAYSTLPGTGTDHSSGNPEHYDTPICNASPTPLSRSSKLEAPQTPLLIDGSRLSKPGEDVGLGRACSTDPSQSSPASENGPGESDPRTEEGVATRGESRSEDWRDWREGQGEGGDPGPDPLRGSSVPPGDPDPSSLPPPNDRKEEMSCCRNSTLANVCNTPPTVHNTNLDNLLPTTSCSATWTSTLST